MRAKRNRPYIPKCPKQIANKTLLRVTKDFPNLFEFLTDPTSHPLILENAPKEYLQTRKQAYARVKAALIRIQDTLGQGEWKHVDHYLAVFDRSFLSVFLTTHPTARVAHRAINIKHRNTDVYHAREASHYLVIHLRPTPKDNT